MSLASRVGHETSFLQTRAGIRVLNSLEPIFCIGHRGLKIAIRCSENGCPLRAESDRTQRVSPPGPKGEAPFFSERDLVVAVDQLGGLKLGRLRAAQETDLRIDDRAAVTVGAVCVSRLSSSGCEHGTSSSCPLLTCLSPHSKIPQSQDQSPGTVSTRV